MRLPQQQLWFTSDLHFGHKPILRPDFDNRPFKNMQEMEDGLVERWNSVVGANDVTIVVGDMFFCGSTKAKTIMERLNGKKILVRGNHDGSTETMLNSGFDYIYESVSLLIAGEMVQVCHYPYRHHWLRYWFNRYLLRKPVPRRIDSYPINKGGWLIHGHTHSTQRVKGKAINVCSNAWNYTPISLKTISTIIENGGQYSKTV